MEKTNTVVIEEISIHALVKRATRLRTSALAL